MTDVAPVDDTVPPYGLDPFVGAALRLAYVFSETTYTEHPPARGHHTVGGGGRAGMEDLATQLRYNNTRGI